MATLMKTDESGAPWPYETVEKRSPNPGEPTWECPTGECACHPPRGSKETIEHRIVLCDSEAKRMPRARCRVVQDGRLLNKDAPFANGAAELALKLRRDTRFLEVEWAPMDVPERAPYPFRKQYYVDLGDHRDEWVHRRLHNLGFSQEPLLADNIRDYQRTYHRAATGRPEDVEAELGVYHDHGALPPVPKAKRADLDLVASPGAAAGPSPGGGPSKQGLLTGIKSLKLLVRVRTRATRPLKGVTVKIGPDEIKREATTDAEGFARFTLDEADLVKLGDDPSVDVEARLRHHGPDPGTKDSVRAGPLSVSARIDGKGWVPIERQTEIDTSKPSTPGFSIAKTGGRYLDLVLMDACMNRGAIGSGPVRRLKPEEVQLDNIMSHKDGTFTLGPKSEYTFKHNTATGEFDDCDDKCELEGPEFKTPLTLIDDVVRQIRWFKFQKDPKGLPDTKIDPGNLEQSFTKHRVGVAPLKTLGPIAQRNLAGVVRLCVRLRNMLDIAAIYTQGVIADGSDSAHGVGLACDFGGCSTKLPNDGARDGVPRSSSSGEVTFKVALGVDFIVWYHWGLIPQWDPTTVAANPGLSVFWKRQPWEKPDSGINFEDPANLDGKTYKNAYRLDPPPFQEPAGTKLAKHFDVASAVFNAVYSVAVEEYTDDDDSLMPLPAGKTEVPTPIDAQQGHKIEHPDYGAYIKGSFDGRFAHRNHLHFQFGPTRPRPGVR